MPVERFHIHISDDILDDLKARLHRTRWPDAIPGSGWERGTDIGELQSLLSYWKDHYSWRAQEAELNRFSQYRCNIDGIDIHFVHERGKGPNPIPILLTHGWPDSYLRYQKLIPLLADPAKYGGRPEDAFDVIVPSIPGFGFSGRPLRSGVNNLIVSEMWAKLMTTELGYSRFVAAGGDIGSGVTRYLAFHRPELLYAIHLTDVGVLRSLLSSSEPGTDEEQQYKREVSKWIAQEGGYMSIQSTKPQTLAYGLTDSPAGLAGWLLEKFHSWSDCKGDLFQKYSKDELVTAIMLYWVTNTIGSANQIYYENTHTLPPIGRIDVPTGIAIFPADVALPPKSWVLRNLNVVRWREMSAGGHFTAMEEPEQMADDIREFCRPFRENSSSMVSTLS